MTSNLKRKAPPKSPIKLVVTARPDLDKFKPAQGKIFDLASRSDPTQPDDGTPSSVPPCLKQLSIDSFLSQTKKEKQSPSTSKPIPKKSSNVPPTKPKKIKKKSPRTSKDKSPDPDEDSNIDDIALSDYSEPETKLRDPDSRRESRRKFAKLRKARKQAQFKKLLNKEVHARRIIPDSDSGIEMKAGTRNQAANTDDDDDDDDDSSSSSGSDCSSETDEEERQRREKEFIVDDMATAAQKNWAQKHLQTHMPSNFRSIKNDQLSHFKTVCEYLVYHALLPQIHWTKRVIAFASSCHYLSDFFTSRALPMLDTSAWILTFRNELNRRPFISLLPDQPKAGCEACNNRTKTSRKVIQLTGQEYSPETLNPIQPKRAGETDSSSGDESSTPEDSGKQHKFKLYNPALSDPSKPQFHCGEDCANRAMDYHFFKHWQLNLLKMMKSKIKVIGNDKVIFKRQFKFNDSIPKEETLRLYKKEIRDIFDNISQEKSSESLENLYHRLFMNRLNRVHKSYGMVG